MTGRRMTSFLKNKSALFRVNPLPIPGNLGNKKVKACAECRQILTFRGNGLFLRVNERR